MRDSMAGGLVERRVTIGLRAAGWVGRRLVAAGLVVGVVLFETMLWGLTHIRITGANLCGEPLSCPRRRPPGPAPDLQPHEALFWLVNGVLVAAAVLIAVIVRLRRNWAVRRDARL